MKKRWIWIIITAVIAVLAVSIVIFVFHHAKDIQEAPVSDANGTSESTDRIPVYSDTLYLEREEELTFDLIEKIVDFEFPEEAYIEQVYITDKNFDGYMYFKQHYDVKIIIPLEEGDDFIETCQKRMTKQDFRKSADTLYFWNDYTYNDVAYSFSSENVIYDYEYGGRYYHVMYYLYVLIDEENYTVLLGIS